jgi:hypothetical protein
VPPYAGPFRTVVTGSGGGSLGIALGQPGRDPAHSYSDVRARPAHQPRGTVGLGGLTCPSRSAETYPLSGDRGISVRTRRVPPSPGVPGEQLRGEEYASPGSCTLPSCCSMHWVVPLGVDRKQPTKGGSLQPESISFGRRVGQFRERWYPCRGVRVQEQARGLPTQSRNSRLPPPAPWCRAAAASDWEPGRSGGSQSESEGLRRPLVLTRGPLAGHLPRQGVPLREHRPWVGGPLCGLGGPVPSRVS